MIDRDPKLPMAHQAIVDPCKWQQVEVGLKASDLIYQPHGGQTPQRLVVVRQHVKRRGDAVMR